MTPASPKIHDEHRARRALIYVRQSTPGQLEHHPESTARQYALRQRAYDLGWPADAVEVIDADLGKSGASADDRAGFQYLVAEVGLGHVGLVLSIESSRLARSGRDWYHLLELCALARTLLADEDGIYDPACFNDRLLLGLKGTMSEAELHLLRQRLLGGALEKARRGALRIPLPTGHVWATDEDGQSVIAFDPDESVQAAVRDVFARFAALGSAAQVLRALVRDGAQLPRRVRVGPGKGQVVWVAPGEWMILQILRDPIYAGAYAYGRQRRRHPGRPGIVRLPPAEWAVLLPAHHPGYIDWATYEANRARLAANQADYTREHPGAARGGAALLQGLARCGVCGRRMRLHYTGPRSDHGVYVCRYREKTFGEPRCQEVRAPAVDAAVAHALLAAVRPVPLAAALHALGDAEREAATRREAWRVRLERARYAAERAARQYDAVEPEHRLVARALEQRWNAGLRELAHLEAQHAREAADGVLTLDAAERAAITALAERLPAVWADPRTTPEDRKRLIRCLIAAVELTTDAATDRITCEIVWVSGARSPLVVSRPVRAYRTLGRYPQLIARVRDLAAQGRTDQQIAAILEAEDLRPARVHHFDGKTIWLLRHAHGIAAGSTGAPPAPAATTRFTVQTLARAIDVTTGTVYVWLRTGRVRSTQHTRAAPHWIDLPDRELAALREHVTREHRRAAGRSHNRSNMGAA